MKPGTPVTVDVKSTYTYPGHYKQESRTYTVSGTVVETVGDKIRVKLRNGILRLEERANVRERLLT